MQGRDEVHPVGVKPAHDLGTLIPDLIVDDLVIVDTKVATTFNESHIAQMTGYLSIQACGSDCC